ncbi:hypothetical protein PR048_008006 [Dryococelus australis]|uniref:Uncharacterized protein n=1 Tax=Dryococelus australis TaxID=614101 RepID=A0ABQ9HW12_9NEOP|nr:hypothetical protein PR048_008006 [Dryococelus australis]
MTTTVGSSASGEDGGVSVQGRSTGVQGRGKRETPEKTRSTSGIVQPDPYMPKSGHGKAGHGKWKTWVRVKFILLRAVTYGADDARKSGQRGVRSDVEQAAALDEVASARRQTLVVGQTIPHLPHLQHTHTHTNCASLTQANKDSPHLDLEAGGCIWIVWITTRDTPKAASFSLPDVPIWNLLPTSSAAVQSSDTHETPYGRVKRCRERKINIKASERVNIDVFTQNKRLCPQHSQTQFLFARATAPTMGQTGMTIGCMGSVNVRHLSSKCYDDVCLFAGNEPWATSETTLKDVLTTRTRGGGGWGIERSLRRPADQRHRPARFPLARNSVTWAGIEPGLPLWEASVLIAQPPWPQSVEMLLAQTATDYCFFLVGYSSSHRNASQYCGTSLKLIYIQVLSDCPLQGHAPLPFNPNPERVFSETIAASARNGGFPQGQSASFMHHVGKPPSLDPADFELTLAISLPHSSLETVTFARTTMPGIHYNVYINVRRPLQCLHQHWTSTTMSTSTLDVQYIYINIGRPL